LSKELIQDWAPLLRLGLPSAASLFIEWGSYEFNAAISGHIGACVKKEEAWWCGVVWSGRKGRGREKENEVEL